jgi:hypothetical protein
MRCRVLSYVIARAGCRRGASGLIQTRGFTTSFNSTGKLASEPVIWHMEQMLENLSMPKSFLRSFLPSAEILGPEYLISPETKYARWDVARVREPYCNKLVIDNRNSIGNAAKLPFRDRSVLVKDTGHRSGTSERKLLQTGFGEFKPEAGPVR